MGDKYTVEFTVEQVKFYELNNFFNLINKQIDESLRNKLTVIITDNIGGKHYFLQQYGLMPTGEKCVNCKNIDCSECIIWSRKKKEE